MDGVASQVDDEIATAVGVFVLTDATLPEVAQQTDVSRRELEAALERAGVAETFDLDRDQVVSETIDDILDT